MFKRVTIICTLIAIIAMTFSKNFIILEFYANRSDIALKYCVNKNKPMLHCNGHCFLIKALKKEQQQEQALGENFGKTIILICQHNFNNIDAQKSLAYSCQKHSIIPANVKLWQLYIVDRLLKPPASKFIS